MIKIDYTLIIQMVNFLFILFVLNILLYRPIRDIIRQRREKFATFEADIDRLTGQAEDSVKAIDDQLNDARRDGFLKKDEIKGQGTEEEKRIIAAASEEADAKIQEIKNQITGEITSARVALKDDIAMFSQELAQKVLGRSLS